MLALTIYIYIYIFNSITYKMQQPLQETSLRASSFACWLELQEDADDCCCAWEMQQQYVPFHN